MRKTFVRKFEDVPYHMPHTPWHAEKVSVKLLIDESLGLGMKNFTFVCLRFEPSGYTTPHKHTFEQAYFYLSGEGLLEIGGEKHKVGPYDTVVIPPGTIHSQKTIGDEPLILVEVTVPAQREFFDDKNIWPWTE